MDSLLVRASALQFFHQFIHCSRRSVLFWPGNFLGKGGQQCSQYLCHPTCWRSPWRLLADSWELPGPALQSECDRDWRQNISRWLQLILTMHRLPSCGHMSRHPHATLVTKPFSPRVVTNLSGEAWPGGSFPFCDGISLPHCSNKFEWFEMGKHFSLRVSTYTHVSALCMCVNLVCTHTHKRINTHVIFV